MPIGFVVRDAEITLLQEALLTHVQLRLLMSPAGDKIEEGRIAKAIRDAYELRQRLVAWERPHSAEAVRDRLTVRKRRKAAVAATESP